MPLPIALVQVASSLDPAENRAALPGLLGVDAELVVLPEAYARDFGAAGSDVSAYAEELDGPFVAALMAAAGDRTVIAGMFERSEDERRPFNTLVVVDRDGVRAAYRKVHLYDSFGYRESDALTPGPTDQDAVVRVGDVRVALQTCYDLRFPEAARRHADAADLLVVPAAWVAGPRKVHHWRTLLQARAIENLFYVAGVGQPAPRYSGSSLLVDPRGGVPLEMGVRHAGAAVGMVDPALVAQAREENPSLSNRRL